MKKINPATPSLPETPISNAADALATIRPFADLNASARAQLAAGADLQAFDAGDTILSSGQDDPNVLLALAEGVVRRTSGLAAAGDIDVTTLHSGYIEGCLALLAGSRAPNPALSMVAETPCKILTIEADDFVEMLSTSDTATRSLLKWAAQCALQAERADAHDLGPERRIMQYLVSLVQTRSGVYVIDPMPRHAALAEAAGVDQRAAAEAIGILTAEGVVERAYPAVIVRDFDRLRTLSK